VTGIAGTGFKGRIAYAALAVLVALTLVFTGTGRAFASTRAPLSIGEFFTDISCSGGATPFVKIKTWGVDGPRNTEIEVDSDILINGEWWRTQEYPSLRSTSTGSWSTPTGQYFTFLTGRYDLFSYAFITSTGQQIGSGSDSCSI
jgi:hypothetical protein